MQPDRAVIKKDLNFAVDYRRQNFGFTKLWRSQVNYLKKVERFIYIRYDAT